MKKTLLFFIFCLASALTAAADDPIPTVQWYIDTEAPAQHDIPIRRGDTVYLQPMYRSYGGAFNLTNATSAELRYKSSDMTGTYYAITGSIYNVTGGIIRVKWTPTAETVTNLLTYDFDIFSPSSTIVRAWGQITLLSSVGSTGTATNPAPLYGTGKTADIVFVDGSGITNKFCFTNGLYQVRYTNNVAVP